MKTDHHPPHARAYVDDLAASGRHHFTSADAQKALGVSPAAAKLALGRLAKQKLGGSPARGFYVIVPPEYRSSGASPATNSSRRSCNGRGSLIMPASCRRLSFTARRTTRRRFSRCCCRAGVSTSRAD